MGLEINTIITLENNERYVVLNETMYQGKKYFLVMGIDQNKEIISSDVAILEEELEGLDIYIKKVTNSSLLTQLANLLKAQM